MSFPLLILTLFAVVAAAAILDDFVSSSRPRGRG
jgi:hypothetical protein